MTYSAFLDFADAARQALLWHPVLPVEDATLALELELAEHGWTLIDVREEPVLEHVLPGQLLKIRLIKHGAEPIAEARARIRDLGQVWIAPVALAIPPPEQAADLPQGLTRLRAATFLPPSTLGQCGVVFDQGQQWVYPLRWLGPKASNLQATLATLLDQLAEQEYLKESARFQHAQVLASQLASSYHAYHLYSKTNASSTAGTSSLVKASDSTQILPPVVSEAILPGALPPAAALPVISPQNTFLIPSPPPVHAVLQAMYAAQEAGEWREQTGVPTYEVVTKRAGRTIVQIRAEPAGAAPDEATTRFLWQIVQALSDVDAVVFLALLGIHMASEPDERGGHWIYLKDVADWRALRPKIHHRDGGKEHRAGPHHANLERLSDAIDRINMVWLQYLQRGASDAPLDKLILIDSMLLKRNTLGIASYHRTSHLAPAMREGRPYAYHIAMGPWLDPFLERVNPPLAQMHQGVLQYRLRDRIWEERLLSHISLHARHQPGPILRFHLRELFATLQLPVDPQRPWDAKKRFEEAMEQLKTGDHYIADWKSQGDIPTSRDWFERWLDSYIEVTLPSPA